MSTFASDGNKAERAQRSRPPNIKHGPHDVGGASGIGTIRLHTPHSMTFRSDAKIWDLYLDMAEVESKDRAALWNTSLDSLLIFAGLFAGVVSSFVIDARTDLQSDSEQRLLSSLLQVAQSGSITGVFDIPVSAYWVTGLWVVSLCMTLFSAVMAVLAKAWLAKYVMASATRRAEDAYRRYRLDAEAGHWHTKVASVLPFLVQFASFITHK